MSDKDNQPGDVAPSSPPVPETPGFTAQELMAAIVQEIVHGETLRSQFKNSKIGKALIALSGLAATALTIGGIWAASYITGLSSHIDNQQEKTDTLNEQVQQQEVDSNQQDITDEQAREKLRQAILNMQAQKRETTPPSLPAEPSPPKITQQSTTPSRPRVTPKPVPKSTPTPQTDFQKLCGSLGLDPASC